VKLAEALLAWKGRLKHLGALREHLVADAVAMDDVLRLAALVAFGLGFFVGLFLLYPVLRPAGASPLIFGVFRGLAWPERVPGVAVGALYVYALAGTAVSLSRRLKSRC
jgi:hypothetical protein